MILPPTDKKIFPLHIHTTNSILDAVSSVEDYVNWCVDNKVHSCSCTDHGYVMGHYDLFKMSEERGIKPIPGVEVYLHPGDDYEHIEQPNKRRTHFDYFHLTLWAMNQEGYRDLMCLCNNSWNEGRVVSKFGNQKPRVTWGDLLTFSQNLICGTGCILGPIAFPILRGERHEAAKSLGRLKKMFSGRVCVEVMPTPSNTDWVKEAVVAEMDDGEKVTFMPNDILETNLGEMTAKQAATTVGVTHVTAVSPQRFGTEDFIKSMTSGGVVSLGCVISEEDL